MKITECPRDALQGLKTWVPTTEKVRYINSLLKVGFDTIDFGSFVSPKAIPQMKDTAQVLSALDFGGTQSKLLAIVANLRGAEDACQYEKIDYLGFPLSLSETFQQRNTRRSIAQALETVSEIGELASTHHKTPVVYLSMGFGNPYGEEYTTEKVHALVQRLSAYRIKIISVADTIGSATATQIGDLLRALIPAFPEIEFGLHLHTHPATAAEKIAAAYQAGCRKIDSAIGGMGGCPMAKDTLTGNLPTETLVGFLKKQQALPKTWNEEAFRESILIKKTLFDHKI